MDTYIELAHGFDEGHRVEAPRLSAGTCAKQHHAVNAASCRAPGVVQRDDIGEDEATIAMHGIDHDLGLSDARDPDRFTPFADDPEGRVVTRITAVGETS